MVTSQIYIAIAIVVLAAIALIVFVYKGKTRKKFTPLASLAFAFVLAGIIFGEDRLIGYSLMGIGVILAVIDAVIKSRP